MIYLVVDKKKKSKGLKRYDASTAFAKPKKKKKTKKEVYVVTYNKPKCWVKRLLCL